MEINLLVFGQIADITGKTMWKIAGVQNTDDLLQKLITDFPALKSLSYSIAVNKVIIRENTLLANDDTVAILPPFSGG
ncbi:MAG TPA: MoaD/ThiS family protein [Chitinophagaceae bacterium]|nr:MoaD/ThiS family protein [Chitinophagaceae bacterium]